MARFAEYLPDALGGPVPPDLATRPARVDDIPALAALRVERGDATAEEATVVFRRLLASDALVLVAARGGRVVGYGAVERFERPGLPPGWYLAGVIVAPTERRCGIGARLTAERIAWIAARAPEAFYVANETNRASIDLHAALGFQLVARDLAVPGMTFTGGAGLLFRVDLQSLRPPIPRAP